MIKMNTGEGRKCGRPTNVEQELQRKLNRNQHATLIPKEVRHEFVSHWPTFSEKRQRCRLCLALTSILGSKCNAHLCFTKDRNYYVKFHVND